MNRETFLKSSAALALGSVALSCRSENSASTEHKKKKAAFKWKMVTTWPPNFPVLGEGCALFAQWVNEMSHGEMEIKI